MARIIGMPLHNIPWEPRPAACAEPIWRYSANPVIRRDAIPGSNSVFNSAVVPYGDKFAGVFRCDTRAVHMNIFSGFSDDGYNWKIDHEPIAPVPAPGMDAGITAVEYRYDPRVVLLEGRYYVSWCNGYHGPTIGLAYTDDFRAYYQIENAFLPFNRNGVLFPRRINGKYMMFSRPSDNGHTPFGDIFLSESPDLVHWGRHRHVMGTKSVSWESTKIGAGPVPIETDEGWLLIYHGVLTSCNGYVYRMGVALLDIDEPWKVICRAKDYLFTPAELYEQVGEVPNVVFPCAALTDAETGRVAIYYGCADTVTGLAFTTADGLIDFAREHS